MSTMNFRASHIVPAPRELVWDWHTRPGALARLTPPFIPMVPLRQADSLASGTTTLGLPAGLKWVARHDLSRFRTGYSFTDVCISAPMRKLAQWRHDHLFADAELSELDCPGGAAAPDRVMHTMQTLQATRITDVVDTRLPTSSLESIFAYRQRQLIADLTFLQSSQALADASLGNAGGIGQAPCNNAFTGRKPLTIAMTGSRGTVGRALMAQLTTAGHNVVQLVRSTPKPARPQVSQRTWVPHAPAHNLLDGVDVLVHLAGEPLLGRFNDAHKRTLCESRVAPTEKLARLVAKSPSVQAMVSASAIGYYGPATGSTPLDESGERGEGFLADLVADWEAATAPAREAGKRVSLIRTGVVLSGAGGLLPVLKAVFFTGLGGSFGDGSQMMSWISIDDLTDIYVRAITEDTLSGVINATAPQPVSNKDFSAALAQQMRRPAVMPIPTLGPALLLGKEGATELALADQNILPGVLSADGHAFRYPTLDTALAHELGGEALLLPRD